MTLLKEREKLGYCGRSFFSCPYPIHPDWQLCSVGLCASLPEAFHHLQGKQCLGEVSSGSELMSSGADFSQCYRELMDKYPARHPSHGSGSCITQSPRSFPVDGGQLCTAATCLVMRSVSVSFRPYLVCLPPYPFLHIPNKLPSNPLSGFTPGRSKNNHIDDVLERRPCRGVWVQTRASSTFLQVTNF